MKHPASCGCRPPKPPVPRPPHSPPADGVLLSRVAAMEKRVIPRLCTVLEAFGLPECAYPLRLQKLIPAEGQPACTVLGECNPCGRVPVCVSIPVRMLICDANGRRHSVSAMVDVQTWIPGRMLECWGCQWCILPCIQLLCGECLSCDARFEVSLHITLDFYLLRPEVFRPGRPAAVCPDLPLYPPPIRH